MKSDDLKRKCLNQHRQNHFQKFGKMFSGRNPNTQDTRPDCISRAANLLEISLSLRKKLYAFLAVVCRSWFRADDNVYLWG